MCYHPLQVQETNNYNKHDLLQLSHPSTASNLHSDIQGSDQQDLNDLFSKLDQGIQSTDRDANYKTVEDGECFKAFVMHVYSHNATVCA